MRVVFELDDLCDGMDPYNALLDLKARRPGLRVTMFAIPSRCSDELLARYRALDWVELGTHGYHHAPQECLVWGYDEAVSKLEELEDLGWPKLFKPPNWQINSAVYEALHFRGWSVADHAAYAWPSRNLPINRYTHNLPGNEMVSVHGHTWDTHLNGPSDWESLFEGIDDDAEFVFVSEACRVIPWGYEEVDDVVQDRNSSWSHESEWGKNSLRNFVRCFSTMNGSSGKIADFGGNDGYVASAAQGAGYDVTVIDGLPNRVLYADKLGVPAVCADLTNIPIPDGAFDWGYCSHTLEHIPDADKAWAEIRRLCKKGCFVVLPVEDEKTFLDNEAHHHRGTWEDWCERFDLEEIGRSATELVGVWKAESE